MMNQTYFLLLICFCVCLHVQVIADSQNEPIDADTHELVVKGFIPNKIPPNITSVTVLEFDAIRSLDENMRYVNSSMFADRSWSGVKSLALKGTTNMKSLTITLTHKCFSYLTRLEVLHISVRRLRFVGVPFYNLTSLSVLKLPECQIYQVDFERAISGKYSLPNLRYIDLSNIWSAGSKDSLSLDSQFLSILFSKPIKGLNLSYNNIKNIDGFELSKSCGDLDYLNVSWCTFGPVNASMTPWCNSIGILDISYTFLKLEYKFGVKFRVSQDITTDVVTYSDKQYTHIKSLKADGIYNGVYISGGGLWTSRSVVKCSQLTSVSLRYNKLKRLDVRVNYIGINLTRIDLSHNELEFFHPMFLNNSWQTLEHIDLSYNRLSLMVKEDKMSFSQIARSYPNLQHIGLAANNLSDVPESMFEYNQFLEVIDLSQNELTTFRLLCSRYNRLRVLYLHANNIVTLDAYAKQCLGSLHVPTTDTNDSNVTVTLGDNPIPCSECNDIDFINWILFSSVISKIGPSAASCLNSDRDKELINQNTVGRLQKVCQENIYKRNTIIFTSVFGSACLMLLIFAVCYTRRYLKAKKRRQEMEDNIALIQNDAGQYAVFLSFCSEDEEFVYGYVKDQLEDILQELLNTDRSLVSTGDRNFRIGRWIAEETVNTLKHSSVIIIVVSNAYCQSRHCQMEFEQAYDLQKPIMLMYKGHVQEDLMFPVMRELYNRYTRILWENVDGEFKLKTTWLNVGNSVLEMLKD